MDENTLRRLAGCVVLAEERRRALETVTRQVEEMGHEGTIVTVGEHALLKGLQELFNTQVVAGFRSLGPETSPDVASDAIEGILDRITQALGDPTWELVEMIRVDLVDKVKAQELFAKELNELLDQYSRILSEADIRFGAARRFRAATLPAERQWKKLVARRRQAERQNQEKKRAEAYQEALALKDEFKQFDDLSKQVEESIRQAEKFCKRADLLVLRSPLDGRSRYEALLRTASEPGVHGINLHAASTVVKQDRDELLDTMRAIKAEISGGGLRQAAGPGGTGDAAVVTAPVPPTRELPVVRMTDRATLPFGVPALKEVGNFMYRLLVPEPVQRYLETASCSLTITANDLDLPWELMHDGTEFLCLARPVARMPMGTYLPPTGRTRGRNEKIRFLLVWPDKRLPGVENEITTIKEALGKWGTDLVEVVELGPDRATGRELNARLRSGDYDVIHYAGHAAFDEEDPDLSGLVLKDEEVFFAQKARRLLGGRPLVFLNACETGASHNPLAADSPARAGYLRAPAEGLASAFIYGGALGCVGTLWPVYDDAAAQLAIDFYNRLLEGSMIGEAMREARQESQKKYPAQVTWAAFVLYGDPTFQLREP